MENKEFNDIPKLNKKVSKVFASIFAGILVVPTLMWGVISMFPSLYNKVNFSTNENRNMSKFPSTFNPLTYTSEINDWYNDNLPFRSIIYTTSNNISNSIEKTYKDGIKPFFNSLFHPLTSKDIENAYKQGYEAGYDKGYIEGLNDNTTSHETDEGKYIIDETKSIEPTCVKDGISYYSCSFCGESYSKVLPATHKGTFIETVLPSYQDYGYDLYVCDSCHSQYRTNIVDKLIDNSNLAPTTYGSNKVIEGRYGWLFNNSEDDLKYYQRVNPLSESKISAVTYWASEINRLCKEKGIAVQFVFIPNKEDVYSEYMPTYKVENVKQHGELLQEAFKAQGLNSIYLKDALVEAKKYFQTYYKVDTHWNNAGGYVGVNEIYKNFNINTISINNLLVTKKEGISQNHHDALTLGSLSWKDYSDIDYDVDYLGYESYFNERNVTGNLLIIGDSFNEAMIQYMSKDFDNATFIHRKNLTNNYSTTIKSANYLVIEFIERQDWQLEDTLYKIYSQLQ